MISSWTGATICQWNCVLEEDPGIGGEWGQYLRAGGGTYPGAYHQQLMNSLCEQQKEVRQEILLSEGEDMEDPSLQMRLGRM